MNLYQKLGFHHIWKQLELYQFLNQAQNLKKYRPFSTLPFIDKLFERPFHSKFYKFSGRLNIFFEDQYGFHKNKPNANTKLKFTDEC